MDAQSATLDTVYATVFQNNRIYDGINRSIEVTGGNVNVYVSNSATEPADESAMTQDQTSVTGMLEVSGMFRWILFESASGTPVVTTLGLLKGE